MKSEKFIIKTKQGIKIKEKIVNIFCFFDYELNKYNTKNDFVDAIVKDVPNIANIGYAGFTKKEELKNHLSRAILGAEESVSISQKVLSEKKVFKIAKDVLKRCYKKIETENIYLFIFPNFNQFKQAQMNGVGGFCSCDNVILIDINPVRGWNNAFKRSLSHEFHHTAVAKIKSPKNWTLLDSFVYEGMADNFTKDVTGMVSPWAKMLSKKESLKLFEKVKIFLSSDDIELYEQVFYKGTKYPMWGGYSIGYQMLKSYLKKHPKYVWNDITKEEPAKILKESDF